MARYNEKRLSYAEQDRMIDMLSAVLERLKSKKKICKFLKDLLNRQERLMIVRRLLIAELLVDDATYDKITEALGASSGTIAKVERRLNFGRRGILAAVFVKKKLK